VITHFFIKLLILVIILSAISNEFFISSSDKSDEITKG
jgi:hypothetical protein